MDAIDEDVHFFTDASTGVNAVVYRGRPSGLRLARQRCMRPPRSPPHGSRCRGPCPHLTPTLTETAAMHQMRHHGLPFPFFNKPVSGRYLLIDTAGGVADPMRLPAVEHDRSRVSSCCRCSAAPPSRRVLDRVTYSPLQVRVRIGDFGPYRGSGLRWSDQNGTAR
jgi:hypothetical protein